MNAFLQSPATRRVLVATVGGSLASLIHHHHHQHDQQSSAVPSRPDSGWEKTGWFPSLIHTTRVEAAAAVVGTTTSCEYDFVVVGHGTAGDAAVQHLVDTCPQARIAVVDPLRKPPLPGVDSFAAAVTALDPHQQCLQLAASTGTGAPPQTSLRYREGLLIATGSRGAPPPVELLGTATNSRILELRTTAAMSQRGNHHDHHGNHHHHPWTKIPPDAVRRSVAAAAAKGARVVVLGSGWEALDLVGLVPPSLKKRKVVLVFGSPGPVWGTLPSYLGTEVRKKLLKNDVVELQERSLVRYVASVAHGTTQKMELHTAKVYDLLDTKRTMFDLLIVAPDSFGARGTAALATTDIPPHMLESLSPEEQQFPLRPWYKTWSQLAKSSPTEPSVIACFEDDGRIAVNAELCAYSNIYAAGSVAKYPNSSTGAASIAGEGNLDGPAAGKLAAWNLSRDYRRRRHPFSQRIPAQSFAAKSLPVWRSDVTSYPASSSHSQPLISSLASLGIQALCIGNCDSDRLQTRAFWWTNSSAQRKFAKWKLLDWGEPRDTNENEEEESSSMTVDRQEQLLRRRTTSASRRERRKLGIMTPAFGVGVVYYLDATGRVRGIMTWGLPFCDQAGGPIDGTLLAELKRALVTNVGVSALDAEENHQIMNQALARQSQELVSLAVQQKDANHHNPTIAAHGLAGPISGFSTPLYRYTEVDALKDNTLGVLKRKEGGGMGVLGEDLYARDELSIERPRDDVGTSADEEARTNLPATNYPIKVVPFHMEERYGKKAASLESLTELNRYLAVQRGWEENENRARPGKEDPIWLRPGDERKQTSQKQMLIDMYRSIMFAHRSQ